MSILSSFKKALGFPDEYDEELYDFSESSDLKLQQPQSLSETPVEESLNISAQSDSELVQESASELPGEVFDAVIELFNSIQPEFVKECLSIESQRKYLLERIGESLRNKLEAETTAARIKGEQMWEAEKKKMATDFDRLKSEYHSLKQQREEFQSAQLSAARQKRALSERIHDLEGQVNTLEAEKEQYQLENRSMLNKLRVAGVIQSSNPDVEAELQRLATENVALQDKNADLQAGVKTLNESLKNAIDEVAHLKSELQQKSEEEGSMSAEQQAAIAEIEEQIKQFSVVRKKKDDKIAELQASLTETREQMTQKESLLTQLQEQLAQVDSRYADKEKMLNEEIRRLTDMINEAEKQQARMRNERKSNKSSKKHVEEIEAPIIEPIVETPVVVESEVDAEQQPSIKISAIDELLDSTDWFTAPDPVPLKKDPEVDEDFGYKEPVRKTSRDDDKQLSLW